MSFSEFQVTGPIIQESLFGGNVLANRQSLDVDGGHGDAIEDLGVTGLRFPGGTLTEYYFDISNPDSEIGINSETGEIRPMISLSKFLDFASNGGHSVTLVLPTRHYLSDSEDANGDRFASIDEEELRGFIRDVAQGKYGSAKIEAFEIGNEYWHSADMNTMEYARVASTMINIIDDELEQVAETFPSASDINIAVQMGYDAGTADLSEENEGTSPDQVIADLQLSFGLELDENALYPGGDVNFYNIANEKIISELERSGAIEAVDGVVTHIYSWGPEKTLSRNYLLNQIEKSWQDDYPDVEVYVTEWNVRGFSDGLEEHEDYGLYQASELLNMMEVFVERGVDHANVWPLIQRTDNALSISNDYGETNAPGALFRAMAEHLPGKVMLDFNPDENLKTEAEFDGFSVHGFADQNDLLFLVTTSHRSGVVNTDLNLTSLVQGFGNIELSVLGVQPGSAPGSNESAADIEHVPAADAIATGFVDVSLDPGEILQITVRDYQATEELQGVLDGVFGETADVPAIVDSEAPDLSSELDVTATQSSMDDFDLPVVPVDEEPMIVEDTDSDIEPDDGSDGMIWLLALLPLAALIGLG